MDFLRFQDQSRVWTVRLIIGLGLAIAVILLCLNLAVLGFVYLICAAVPDSAPFSVLAPYYIVGTTSLALILIVSGSFWRIGQLKGDGIYRLAESMGARPFVGGNVQTDHKYLRFRNIVQEMALAAEIPPPQIFLLPEPDSINAFILGWSQENTLIAVSEGALTYLSRDELQALTAIEFAHIFNRDISLNLRLIGILYGLELIYRIGEKGMQRILFLDDYGNSILSNNDSGVGGRYASPSVLNSIAPQSSLGLGSAGFTILPWPALICQYSFAFFFACIGAIGLLGKWTADLIRRSINRQREYQSDALAVQYTRYPDALASTLAKAGAINSHKKSKRFNFSETGHLFFVSVAPNRFWSQICDPHPTIESRLQSIFPNRDSEFLKRILLDLSRRKIEAQAAAQGETVPKRLPSLVPDPQAQLGTGVAAPPQTRVVPSKNTQNLDFLSPLVKEQIRSSAGVKLVLFALFLDIDWFKQQRQKQELRQLLDDQEYQIIVDVHREICRYELDEQIALTVQTLERGTLMGPREYASFRSRLLKFQKPLGQSNLYEIVLRILFETRLNSFFSPSSVPITNWNDSSVLDADFAQVLHFLALRGSDNAFIAQEAFQDAAQFAHIPVQWSDSRKTTGASFAQALQNLTSAPGALRQRYLDALIRCIEFDGKITIQERSLISGVRAVLGF